jgi:hypothetical protein
MVDRFAYERGLLCHLLTVRTPEGFRVICAETLLREFADDLRTRGALFTATPEDLRAWAFSAGARGVELEQNLCCLITQAYRIMVGAFSCGHLPEWLCAPPSPQWGSGHFPAWNRHGRQIV